MTHVTCRLTAKNRDQLRNPALGNRVWATFTFLPLCAVLVVAWRVQLRDLVAAVGGVAGPSPLRARSPTAT